MYHPQGQSFLEDSTGFPMLIHQTKSVPLNLVFFGRRDGMTNLCVIRIEIGTHLCPVEVNFHLVSMNIDRPLVTVSVLVLELPIPNFYFDLFVYAFASSRLKFPRSLHDSANNIDNGRIQVPLKSPKWAYDTRWLIRQKCTKISIQSSSSRFWAAWPHSSVFFVPLS